MITRVVITGNTFPVKDQIKALGGKWDGDRKCWTVPAAKATEARKLVESAPAAKPITPGKCRDCGKSCKDPYTQCFDCRDGGSRGNGGMSYYDRNGNFVLGDDD